MRKSFLFTAMKKNEEEKTQVTDSNPLPMGHKSTNSGVSWGVLRVLEHPPGLHSAAVHCYTRNHSTIIPFLNPCSSGKLPIYATASQTRPPDSVLRGDRVQSCTLAHAIVRGRSKKYFRTVSRTFHPLTTPLPAFLDTPLPCTDLKNYEAKTDKFRGSVCTCAFDLGQFPGSDPHHDFKHART